MEILLGWLANAIYGLGGMFRSPKTTIAICIIGNLLYVLYYCLLGLFNPAVIMLSNTTCALAMLLAPKKYQPYLAAISIIASITFISFNITSYIDLYIIFAACFLVFANYNKEDYRVYKSAIIASQILWVLFSAHNHDYPMMACCLVIGTTNAYSLFINIRKDTLLETQPSLA